LKRRVKTGPLEKGAAMGPEDATVLNDLGLSYLGEGRTSDALRVLQKAVTLDPNHTEAQNSLGNGLHESGNAAGAEQAYRNAIRAQPDFAAAQLNLAKLLVARGISRRLIISIRKSSRQIRNRPSPGTSMHWP
jgi:Flp pilus assembly protein TadD